MRLIVFLLGLCSGLSLAAQASFTGPELPRLTVKTNLSPLLNTGKQAYAFAVDLRLTPWMSVDVGAGAFFQSTLFADQAGESYRGPRLRAGVKFFTPRVRKSAFHLGLEGKYHDIRNVTFREVLRQGGQYTQLLRLTRTVESRGLAARVGWMYFLGRKKRFLIEPFMGAGFQTHRVAYSLPPDAELLDGREPVLFQLAEGFQSVPDFLFGVQVGLAWW